jgi:YggT family protein
MNTMTQIGIFLINTLGSIYLMIILLRFLLQLVRADYYNPISRMIVTATNPLLVPLRKVIPGVWGIDWACLVLALLLKMLLVQLIFTIAGIGWVGITSLVAVAFLGILSLIATTYFWALMIIVIASWVAPHSHNPGLSLLRQLIEPSLSPIRKIVPAPGGLDFSPMIALLLLHIFNTFVMPSLAASLGVPMALL